MSDQGQKSRLLESSAARKARKKEANKVPKVPIVLMVTGSDYEVGLPVLATVVTERSSCRRVAGATERVLHLLLDSVGVARIGIEADCSPGTVASDGQWHEAPKIIG